LDEKRQKAIQEIFDANGLRGVIAFADEVESPNKVGWVLGLIAGKAIDSPVLRSYLDTGCVTYRQFIGGFVWGRYQNQGWEWVDGLDRTDWTLAQKCQLLMYLPFEVDTWERAFVWLGDAEDMYWQSVPVNPYQSQSDLLFAIDKLLEASRPREAIDCIISYIKNYHWIQKEQSGLCWMRYLLRN